MTSTRSRSIPLSAVLCLASAIVLILSPAAEAAKKKSSSGAKKNKAADAAVGAAPPSAASQAWEPPPKGDLTVTPLPPPAETKPAPVSEPPSAPPSAPPAAPSAESPVVPPQPEPSPPPPPEEAAMPALVPPPPAQYVEHLGPGAYPGMRGLYGGSLWLEPSFHGLQWPLMTRTGVGVSGSAWVDTGYEQITRGPAAPNTVRWLQQGRAVLRVTPTYASGRFFVQAQAELVANETQSKSQSDPGAGIVDTDDLWLRIGWWNSFDLKVGRFEGWEVYHTGMGLDINTLERRGATQEGLGGSNVNQPDYYGVTYLHDRPTGEGLGNVAVHFFPLRILRFEALGRLGTANVQTNSDNSLGGRGVGILDLGWLKVKGGGEYVKVTRGQDQVVTATNPDGSTKVDASGNAIQVKQDSKYRKKQYGVGGAVQIICEPYLEFGGNIGRGWTSETDDNGNANGLGTYNTTSVGGFANLRIVRIVAPHAQGLDDLLLGGGVNWTRQDDSHRDSSGDVDQTAHLQTFIAVQYLVAKQLFVKAVLAYARSDYVVSFATPSTNTWSDYMYSARIRLMYLY